MLLTPTKILEEIREKSEDSKENKDIKMTKRKKLINF